ncbi:MAG TPA: nuclear transport factor 2 family protein [Patescibacteria group bacterium]|nr:nuclear transport factor 2 family protein [Patescibacteria group bacterium]
MKHISILFFTALVFLSACDNNNTGQPDNKVGTTTAGVQNKASTEQELHGKLDEWIRAIVTQDRVKLNTLASDDHLYTGFDGSTFTKSSNIESLTNPMFRIEKIETEDVKVRIYGNTGVVTGIAKLKMSAESGASTSDTRFTQTWVQQQNDWKLVSEHTSQIPAQSGGQ